MSIISEMLRFFLLLEGVWDCNSVSHPHLSCRNNKGYDFANRDCLASEWDAYVQFLFHLCCLDLPMVDSIFSYQPRQEREAALPIQSRTIYFSRAKIQSKDLRIYVSPVTRHISGICLTSHELSTHRVIEYIAAMPTFLSSAIAFPSPLPELIGNMSLRCTKKKLLAMPPTERNRFVI